MFRPIPIQHYLSVMRINGYAESELLADTEINVSLLSDPSYLIEHESYQVFLNNMIRLSGDCGLGLDIGLQNEVSDYGILAYSGLSSPSIRYGMEEIWSKYGHACGIMTRLRVISSGTETAAVQILAPRPSEPVFRFSIEEALCILLKIGAPLTHTSSPPFKKVFLSYPEPGYSQRYHELFQCPVEFDSAETSVVLEQRWLDLPLKTCDVELNRICREQLDHVLRMTESTSSTTLRLRHLLLSRTTHLPSLEDAAREFGVSPRTLTRQLQKDGYSYRHLTEEVRTELAQRWLKSPGLTSKEISFRLGFRDVGAFRRAFKHWTGLTVSEYCQPSADAPDCQPFYVD